MFILILIFGLPAIELEGLQSIGDGAVQKEEAIELAEEVFARLDGVPNKFLLSNQDSRPLSRGPSDSIQSSDMDNNIPRYLTGLETPFDYQ